MSVKTRALPTPEPQISANGIFHLLVVYIVWSSTYLGIRLAVREGAGFPPFTLGMMRTIASSILLFSWAKLSGQKLKATGRELLIMGTSGVLLWTGANGLVTYAEQHADSGLVALLMATMPIWVAAFQSLLDRKLPGKLVVFGLLLGFIGIGVLSVPALMHGIGGNLSSLIATFFAAISWTAGTLLQSRHPVSLKPSASSGYQMLGASIGFTVVALLIHEPAPTPNTEAWLAYAYLVVFGTFAFLSYVTVLQLLPTNLVMTYAYVNPVLAVFLGWLVLREPVTWWTVGGAVFVLLGIAVVFRARKNGG